MILHARNNHSEDRLFYSQRENLITALPLSYLCVLGGGGGGGEIRDECQFEVCPLKSRWTERMCLVSRKSVP